MSFEEEEAVANRGLVVMSARASMLSLETTDEKSSNCELADTCCC